MTSSVYPSPGRPARPPRRLRPSVFWSVRRGIPTWLKIVMPAIGAGIPLIAWAILSYGQLVTPIFLPTPTQVLVTGWQMLTDGDLLSDILVSTGRVLGGFVLAGLVGIPVGILMGTFHSMEGLFSPIVGAIRYMPVAAFVPLVVIWVGLGEPAKITIVFMGIVLYNAIMVADAVKFIPNEILNAAYTLGANRVILLFRVIVPAALPSILDTMRVNIAGAWNFLVLAELIAAQQGLGFRIIQSQRYLQTDKVLFCIAVIGVIGLVTDFVLKQVAIALTPWAEHHAK